MKNLVRALVVLLAATFAPVVVAGAAQATSCNYYTDGVAYQNLYVCTDYDPQGYQALLILARGSASAWMDFNLVCNNGHTYGDTGAFYATANGSYTYVFKVGSQGTCHTVAYNRTYGTQHSGPSVTR